jgi:hypothetical protein
MGEDGIMAGTVIPDLASSAIPKGTCALLTIGPGRRVDDYETVTQVT